MKSRRSMILACICAGVFVLAGCGSDDGGGNGNGGGKNGGQDTMTGDEDTMNGGEEEDTMNGGGVEDTTNGGNGDDTTDNGNGGQCEPLDPPPVEGAGCSVLCQDCSGNQACVIGQNPQTGETVQRCQPAGSGTQGDTCGRNSPCQAGFGCVATQQGAQPKCRKYCRANSDASPQCEGEAECQSQQGAGYGICIVPQSECSLYPDTSNSCGDGQTCTVSASGQTCSNFNENAAAGDSCEAPSDCNKNQICVPENPGGPASCIQLCNPDDPQNCGSDESCSGITFEEGAQEPATFVCR